MLSIDSINNLHDVKVASSCDIIRPLPQSTLVNKWQKSGKYGHVKKKDLQENTSKSFYLNGGPSRDRTEDLLIKSRKTQLLTIVFISLAGALVANCAYKCLSMSISLTQN